MAQNYIQEGDVISWTNGGSAVTSGSAVTIGGLVGVALGDIANGATGQVMLEGVFELTKVTGSGKSFAVGAPVYHDATAGKMDVTDNSAANKLAGYAIEAAGTSATTVKVRLLG